MNKSDLLYKLADKYSDWLDMAKSFGLKDADAKDLVQDMFIRLNDYVKEPQKLMYNENEVNKFYIYVTLKNMFYKRKEKTYFTSLSLYEHNIISDSNENEIYTKELFDDLIDSINDIKNKWYWYDKKLFDLYFNTDMSMRDLSKKTKISLSSIFNTISNAKEKIREQTQKEYEAYISSKNKV